MNFVSFQFADKADDYLQKDGNPQQIQNQPQEKEHKLPNEIGRMVEAIQEGENSLQIYVENNNNNNEQPSGNLCIRQFEYN